MARARPPRRRRRPIDAERVGPDDHARGPARPGRGAGAPDAQPRRHAPLDPPAALRRALLPAPARGRLDADGAVHRDPLPHAERQAARPARRGAAAVHAVRHDVPAHRQHVADAPARRDLPRHLPAHRGVRPRVVRLGLSADGLHGVPLPADRAPHRGRLRRPGAARPPPAPPAPAPQVRGVRRAQHVPRPHLSRLLRRRERARPLGDAARPPSTRSPSWSWRRRPP